MKVLKRIEQVIDTSVRPYLNGHGGDIEIMDFSEGVLKIKLTGMCSNCPSSLLTTEEVVKKEVMENIDEVKSVQLEAGVSDSLIDFAKKLLRHE